MLLLAEETPFWVGWLVEGGIQLLCSILGAFLGFIFAIKASNVSAKEQQNETDRLLLRNLNEELSQIASKKYEVENNIDGSTVVISCLTPVLNSQSILDFILKNNSKIFDCLKNIELNINNINSWYDKKANYYFQNIQEKKTINSDNDDIYKAYVRTITNKIAKLKNDASVLKTLIEDLLNSQNDKKAARKNGRKQ